MIGPDTESPTAGTAGLSDRDSGCGGFDVLFDINTTTERLPLSPTTIRQSFGK